MTVEQLMASPAQQISKLFCASLPMDKQLELASATVLTAVKQ